MVNVQIGSVVSLVRRFGKMFRETLIHDRISEELRLFCANRSVDEIFVRNYWELMPTIRKRLDIRMTRLNVSQDVKIEHLVIPKPDIPAAVIQQV